MKNTKSIVLVIALLLVGFAIYSANKEEPIVFIDEETINEVKAQASSFDWEYEQFNSEGTDLVHTRIFLKTTYENGKTVQKKVAEAQGTCNAVDPQIDEDKDMVSGTTKIQCYAAGFGHWFKIVKGSGSYDVMKKDFEEASPDYTPPITEYVTVVDFPLTY